MAMVNMQICLQIPHRCSPIPNNTTNITFNWIKQQFFKGRPAGSAGNKSKTGLPLYIMAYGSMMD
jgi:hypothetical protein